MTRTHWIVCTVGALLAFTVAGNSAADVSQRDWKTPGDGLLTYDDISRREWLDLTETQLLKFPGNTIEEQYAAVVAETLPDGMLSEFMVAGEEDVRSLSKSAGVDTSTLVFSVNSRPSGDAIDLLGNTLTSTVSGNTRAGGFIMIPSQDIASVWVVYNPNSRDSRTAGFRDRSGTLEPPFGFFGPPPLVSTSGVWLYRQIPEPSSCSLASELLVLLMFAGRVPRSVAS